MRGTQGALSLVLEDWERLGTWRVKTSVEEAANSC